VGRKAMELNMKFYRIITIIILIGGIFLNACNAKPSVSDKKAVIPSETPTIEEVQPVDPTLIAATNAVISKTPKTFCNPVNIGYQYQTEYNSRESADPAVIMYKGDYYLFASHGSGYWWSNDLVNWNYVYATNSGFPVVDSFAPGVCIYNDEIYINGCGNNSIYKTSDPKSGEWELVSSDKYWWLDPALFVDDDGKVYNYFGCSNTEPLYVVQLDPKDMTIMGERKRTNYSYPQIHGFEVSGEHNTSYNNNSTMEGPWMTKYNGKYYLQYATPGTEYGTYANGCYTSDSPMGPFTFAENRQKKCLFSIFLQLV
jgi:beta-xylosidase